MPEHKSLVAGVSTGVQVPAVLVQVVPVPACVAVAIKSRDEAHVVASFVPVPVPLVESFWFCVDAYENSGGRKVAYAYLGWRKANFAAVHFLFCLACLH